VGRVSVLLEEAVFGVPINTGKQLVPDIFRDTFVSLMVAFDGSLCAHLKHDLFLQAVDAKNQFMPAIACEVEFRKISKNQAFEFLLPQKGRAFWR
jgi:hypothetical protein